MSVRDYTVTYHGPLVVGERVGWTSRIVIDGRVQVTEDSGVYSRTGEDEGAEYHYFTDGVLNGTRQPNMGHPASVVTNPPRHYVVGLPVVVTVQPDGSVTFDLDLSEADDLRDAGASDNVTAADVTADAVTVRAAVQDHTGRVLPVY